MFSKIVLRTPFQTLRTMSSISNPKIYKNISQEWYYPEKNIIKIGLTDNIIEDILFIDVEEIDIYNKGDDMVYIENTKIVSSIEALFDCELDEINTELFENLDILNKDPENTDTSWIIKIRPVEKDYLAILETNHQKLLDDLKYNHSDTFSPACYKYDREFLFF
jgi:glycine cleavage system H lipoate-binding protein